jgi:hypothetical protein
MPAYSSRSGKYGKSSSSRPTTSYRRSQKPSGKNIKSLSKVIKRVVRAQAEQKTSFASVSNLYFNSAISVFADIQQILPGVGPGVADNCRIGDQIRASSLTVTGAMMIPAIQSYLNTYNSAPNSRIAIRQFIVQPRGFGAIGQITTNYQSWLPLLLKKGGAATAFGGSLSDLWAPVNDDVVNCLYDKIHYVSTPTVLVPTTIANNNVSCDLTGTVKFFKINIPLKNKLLLYDQNIDGGLSPTNYNPVMVIGYVHLDGSSADIVSTAITLSFDSVFNYTDM